MKIRSFAHIAALDLSPGEEREVDGRIAVVRDLLDAGMIAKVETTAEDDEEE